MGKVTGIVGMRVHERAHHAPHLQEVLTRYGSVILSRQGIPSADRECGLITLICECDGGDLDKLVSDLSGVPGVDASSLTL